MYKVVIADDHMPVLNYLTSAVPWGELGLELAAACADGEEALQACRRVQPDILVTDIGMPIMNGLELIEQLRAEQPGVRTVILSCHEEFHYAQQAVKLHVSDYILKETLQVEQLSELLGRLVALMEQERAVHRERRSLQDVVERNRSALRTSYVRSLLEQPVWDEAKWYAAAKAQGVELQPGLPYMPVLVVLDRCGELLSRFGGEQSLQFVADNALSESMAAEGSVVAALDERQYAIFYPFPKTLKINVYERLRSDLSNVQKLMQRHLKISASFYWTQAGGTLPEIKGALQSLLTPEAVAFRFYAGERCLAKLEPVRLSDDDLFLRFAEALQMWRACLVEADEAGLAHSVGMWMAHIRARRYPVETVRSWVTGIVADIGLKHAVVQHFMTNYNAEALQRTVAAIDTLEYMQEWLLSYLRERMAAARALRERHTHVRKEVADAQRYVMAHLHEKIGMEEMATRLKLNPTHFSRIFKKETGETFVEFVTRRKMERAAELLDKSDHSVEQIAEQLGYEHTSYFIKLFRAYSGLSPLEYRRQV